MAEPDWALWQSILQQIQADMGEVKAGIAKLDRRADHIERDMRDLRGQFIYALGAATAADLRSREVEGRVDDLDEKMKALDAVLVGRP